jgi:hypothetical protein
MKRLSAALIFGFLASSFCFAQIQTGNASYNSTKSGFTISHSSLSFNTRVKVINLQNGRAVEAVVNGRIPINSERIADISRDAGDALGIEKTGMTRVEIEILPAHVAASAETPAQDAGPEQPPQPVRAESAPSPVPREQAAPAQQERAAPPPPQILPLQTVTDIQYIPVPAAGQLCCNTPLLVAILVLLILAILCLLIILILLLRHLLLWPWHYKVWYRRHLLYAKRHRD